VWLNWRASSALDPLVAEHMTAGAVALTACAGLLFALAGLHYSFGRRGSRVSAAALVGLAAASFVGPLAARGPAVEPRAEVAPAAAPGGLDPAAPGPGVALVLLDGASLRFIVRSSPRRCRTSAACSTAAAITGDAATDTQRRRLDGGATNNCPSGTASGRATCVSAIDRSSGC
jgi:hypothetical protein